jgi:hypothetical protein
VKVDLQGLGVDHNVQIAVSPRGFLKTVVARHLTRGDADGLIVVATSAGNHVRHLRRFSRNGCIAGITLVGVGVACDHRVGANACRITGTVDLLEHQRAAGVAVLAEGRMMDPNDQGFACSGVCFSVGKLALRTGPANQIFPNDQCREGPLDYRNRTGCLHLLRGIYSTVCTFGRYPHYSSRKFTWIVAATQTGLPSL